MIAVRLGEEERVQRPWLDLGEQRAELGNEACQLLRELPVRIAERAHLFDAQTPQCLAPLGPTHLRDVPETRVRIAERTVGDVHHDDPVSPRTVPRDHPAGGDDLVVRVRCEHQDGSLDRLLRKERWEEMVTRRR